MEFCDKYTGEVSPHGLRHGKGSYEYGNGFRYMGDWFHGIKHGKGVFQICDGSYYEGDFRHGEMTGYGKRVWPNGSTYEGEFCNGESQGKGKYLDPVNQLKYVGEFHSNQFNGQGIWSKQGNHYQGSFKDNKISGFGEAIWENGDVYVGEWSQGLRHGKGKFVNSATKVQYDGLWRNDQPVLFPTNIFFVDCETQDEIIREIHLTKTNTEANVKFGVFADTGQNQSLVNYESNRTLQLNVVSEKIYNQEKELDEQDVLMSFSQNSNNGIVEMSLDISSIWDVANSFVFIVKDVTKNVPDSEKLERAEIIATLE